MQTEISGYIIYIKLYKPYFPVFQQSNLDVFFFQPASVILQ
jgi:hypothetical protein